MKTPEQIAEEILTAYRFRSDLSILDGIAAAIQLERERAEKAEAEVDRLLKADVRHPNVPAYDRAISRAEKAERELAEAEKIIVGIIEGCVHPDKAVRAVMVNLEPLRAFVQRRKGE